jgi:hypothetical protein
MVTISGNLEVGRTRINGENYFTVKEDKHGGGVWYGFNNELPFELKFCGADEELDGRDPEKCLRIKYSSGW